MWYKPMISVRKKAERQTQRDEEIHVENQKLAMNC